MIFDESEEDIKITISQEMRENFVKFSIIINKEKDEVIIQSESKARLEDIAMDKMLAIDFLQTALDKIRWHYKMP